MGRHQQTASQFAGTEEAAPADAFTHLPTASTPLRPPPAPGAAQATASGQRLQSSFDEDGKAAPNVDAADVFFNSRGAQERGAFLARGSRAGPVDSVGSIGDSELPDERPTGEGDGGKEESGAAWSEHWSE